jgi:hypothetical protein
MNLALAFSTPSGGGYKKLSNRIINNLLYPRLQYTTHTTGHDQDLRSNSIYGGDGAVLSSNAPYIYRTYATGIFFLLGA